jgi:hypothetical protein
MKKLLLLLLSVPFWLTLSAQDTLVAYQFNVINSNAPTVANSFNTGDLLLREPAYASPYTFPAGNGSFCLSSVDWLNAMSFSGGYYTMFSSVGKKNLIVSSRQKSSATGPRDFILQYKIGTSGLWADVTGDTIKCSSYSFIPGWAKNIQLPVVCENKPDVYLRWVVISDSNTTGGLIDVNGTSSIDNVVVLSLSLEASSFLDINRIKANIHTGGVNFYENAVNLPTFGMAYPSFEYPKDSGKYTIFCSALWLGGKNQGNLHLAGERYHGNGRDYNPGPVMDSVQAITEMINWNQVWKINKSDIDYHITHWNSPGYMMPDIISQWPVYANPVLGYNYYLAPFVDADSNGTYTPGNGDYPKIRGDQAIYYIFNDSVYRHSETKGKKLGVEVHAMAYAYNTDPLLEKTVFVNYLVYNRSSRIYDSLYMGLFTDFDIGYPQDDYIGCDSLLSTYFGYNGVLIDGDGTGYSYGSIPPVQTVTFLNQPMSSFKTFSNTGGTSAYSDPDIAPEYYYLMTIKAIIDSVYGWGISYVDTLYFTNFMYSGNPCDSNIYTESGIGNAPNDRRGVGNTGPFILNPGQFISYDIAYTVMDSVGDFCGQNFNNFQNNIIQIQDFFDSHFPYNGNDLALSIETENPNNITPQFNVYPNPTHSHITFTTNLSNTNFRLDIMDISGRLIQSYECKGTKKEMNVSDYKKGVYILKISFTEQSSFVKFIKM